MDYIITSAPFKRDKVLCEYLGEETFVHIAPEGKIHTNLAYLDHDANDQITQQFLEKQGIAASIRRNFFNDSYAILDAVAMGLGQAVISKHLVRENRHTQVIAHKKKFSVKVYLQCFGNTYQTMVQQQVKDALKKGISKYL